MRDAVGGGAGALPPLGYRASLGAVFRAILEEQNEDIRLDLFIHYSAGSVLGGVRPAALVRISCPVLGVADAWRRCGENLCDRLGLSAFSLDDKNGLVLLYRESAVRKVLRGVPARRFLLARGYPAGAMLSGDLAQLRRRFRSCSPSGSFPHEIGIFLGYPLADVVAFSSGDRMPLDCRGYWRVFHRPEKARRTFDRMDRARVSACLGRIAAVAEPV